MLIKNFYTIIFSIFIILFMTGCTNSFVKNYPDISDNFAETEQKQLSKLCEDGNVSEDDLYDKLISSLPDEKLTSIYKNIQDVGKVNITDCMSDENYINFTLEILLNRDGLPETSTTLIFNYSKPEEKLESIKDLQNGLWYGYSYCLLYSAIESNDDDSKALDIAGGLNNEEYIENKIYYSSNNTYYCPNQDGSYTIYFDLNDAIDAGYTSFTNYMDNEIKENEENLEELQDNLNTVRKYFGD